MDARFAPVPGKRTAVGAAPRGKTPVRATRPAGQPSAPLACACGGGCPRCGAAGSVQARVARNASGDRFEREADSVAADVTRTAPAASRAPEVTPLPPGGGMPDTGGVEQNLGSGEPLAPAIRRRFEHWFASDFSAVRIHRGAAAATSAEQLHAHAYTSGEQIVFGTGRYQPETATGQQLLAHELTHVLQQCGGKRAIQRAAPPATAAAPTVTPAQAAVNALLPNASGFDVTYLTVDLLEGILRAEAAVEADRLVQVERIGKTRGPANLGEAEIGKADATFVTAGKQFASVFPGPPSGWTAKAMDPNWMYFYVAAIYLLKLDDASQFQPDAKQMASEGAPGSNISDQDIGIHDLGLITYHGGFDRVAAYRRKIAGEPVTSDTFGPYTDQPADVEFRKRHGIGAGFKRWQVTHEIMLAAIREGLFMYDSTDLERMQELVTYLQNTAGQFDFGFDVAVYLEASRRFYISRGNASVSVEADFPGGRPGNAPATSYTYTIWLYADPWTSIGGKQPTKGFSSAPLPVGSRQTHSWSGLPEGHYRFAVMKTNGPVLHGEGSLEFS